MWIEIRDSVRHIQNDFVQSTGFEDVTVTAHNRRLVVAVALYTFLSPSRLGGQTFFYLSIYLLCVCTFRFSILVFTFRVVDPYRNRMRVCRDWQVESQAMRHVRLGEPIGKLQFASPPRMPRMKAVELHVTWSGGVSLPRGLKMHVMCHVPLLRQSCTTCKLMGYF